jgi:hypothetical protein
VILIQFCLLAKKTVSHTADLDLNDSVPRELQIRQVILVNMSPWEEERGGLSHAVDFDFNDSVWRGL